MLNHVAPEDVVEDEAEDKKKKSGSKQVRLDRQSKNRALGSIVFKYSDNIAGKIL